MNPRRWTCLLVTALVFMPAARVTAEKAQPAPSAPPAAQAAAADESQTSGQAAPQTGDREIASDEPTAARETKPAPHDATPSSKLVVAGKTRLNPSSPFAAQAAGTEEQTQAAESSPLPAKRITLQAAGTPINDALRLVAEQGGLNLVIGPDVQGEVSVYLEDVPVETALRAIAVNNGFAFTVESGVITVSRPPEPRPGDTKDESPPLQTRVFTLQWQDAERVRDALEYALSTYGRIKVLNENSQPGYGGTKLSELSGDIENNTTTAYQTTAAGQGGATGASGTTTTELPRNSRTLVLTDTAENMVVLADLIADLDRVPPQVLVEARIVEMSTDLQRQLGIDWDVNILANGPMLNHTLPLDWRAGFAPGTQIRYGRDGTPRNAVGMALGTIDFTRFQAIARAHQSDSAIRLLANPRMLIFNNHDASILVGERYPILEANITDQGTLTEAFDTYIPVGIQLQVTPTIMADGRISMLVHPSTSALGDEVIGTTGLRVRRILTREIDTRVIMNDGQTIVLGGLISDRKTRTITKMPGVGDIPILDALFRQESPTSQRVDLLVFLTAQIEGATRISQRDQAVFEMYRPHFKHVEVIRDVPLHFEIPTEYEPAKPMFGDPPADEALDTAIDAPQGSGNGDAAAGSEMKAAAAGRGPGVRHTTPNAPTALSLPATVDAPPRLKTRLEAADATAATSDPLKTRVSEIDLAEFESRFKAAVELLDRQSKDAQDEEGRPPEQYTGIESHEHP